jgi:hypothetical protein
VSGSEGLSTLEELVPWARDSLQGQVSPSWDVPPLPVVESWFDQAGLSIVEGPQVSQIELIHVARPGPPRLAFRSPVTSYPVDLGPNRLACLAAVLGEAQALFRMVRLGSIRNRVRVVVQAEVDLTGAPLSMLPFLVPCGLDALRLAVRRLLSSLGPVVDLSVSSQALDHNLAGFPPAISREVSHD